MQTVMPSPTSPPVLEWIRDQTRSVHDRAEENEFQKLLAKGQLPKSTYVCHLQQMYLLHQSLEGALREIESQQTLSPWPIAPDAYLLDRIAQDLSYFESPIDAIQSVPTLALMRINMSALVSHPEFLLGAHYVLQGSLNGSRYFVHRIRQAYQLSGSQGTGYLDPFGETQPARWQDYKMKFNQIVLDWNQRQRVMAGAQWMFMGIMMIGKELYHPIQSCPNHSLGNTTIEV